MPRVKIDYIVSFSDEDPEHPASNLLSWEVDKKRWLCRPGESSCSVVLQLTRAVQISAIHIGSYHSAVIEVLVGRSETPNDPFEVLVPSSVFLSPLESRKEPQDRVRSFSGDQLASTKRADRVRVICRQPYNKQCKYGLSFIHIFEPESASSSSAPARVPSPVPVVASRAIAASAFGNSSSDDEDYRPGQLFAASSSPASNTGSQIRQATSKILKNISDTSSKIVKSPIAKQNSSSSKQNTPEPSQNRHRSSLMYTDDEEQPNRKIDAVVQRHNDEKAKEKEAREAKEKAHKEKMKKDKQDSQAKRDENRGKDFSVFIDNDDRKLSNDNSNKHNKEKNNNHNTSRTDKKDDASKRNDNNVGQRNRDDKDKHDRSIENQNKQRHRHDRKEEVRPGGSNDSNHTSKRDRNRDEYRKTVKRQRPSKDSGSLQAGPVSSTPETLLSKCSLVLSGYVHPRRGNIRTAALACGASVLPDWGPRATHLICAFPNTPKLHQALATNPATPIATGEWVEKCCELRRLLPWQWFATEPSKRVPMPDLSTLPDGDEQIKDEDCDTDEEIEKVLREQKKRRRSNTPETQAVNTSTAGQNDSTDDVKFVKDERIKGNVTLYDSDSDGDKTVDGSQNSGDDDRTVDGGGLQDSGDEGRNVASPTNNDPSSTPRVPSLPSFFDGHTFAIAPDAAEFVDVALLKRYVRAYGGVLVEDWSPSEAVDFVLCGESHSPQSDARCVRADWVWRCHHKQRLCATDRYLVTPDT